jgi:hypothetical protein
MWVTNDSAHEVVVVVWGWQCVTCGVAKPGRSGISVMSTPRSGFLSNPGPLAP